MDSSGRLLLLPRLPWTRLNWPDGQEETENWVKKVADCHNMHSSSKSINCNFFSNFDFNF